MHECTVIALHFRVPSYRLLINNTDERFSSHAFDHDTLSYSAYTISPRSLSLYELISLLYTARRMLSTLPSRFPFGVFIHLQVPFSLYTMASFEISL